MKTVLRKCEQADLEYLSNILENFISVTNDKMRTHLLRESEESDVAREKLISVIEKQIRYFGSSNAAYMWRKITRTDGGVSVHVIIDDVSKKLKVNLKKGGSVEDKLECLASAVVEKELIAKSPKALVQGFEDMGLGSVNSKLVQSKIKANSPVMVIPILMEVIGPQATLAIVETIVISILAQYIGKEAAKYLVRELSKRNPWINALGPLVWTLSIAWLAFDLQGPAFRKTVPILLYLGMVSLRDGLEKPYELNQ